MPSSANHCTNDAPYRTSPFASASGLPCSSVITSARSSACCSIRSCHLRSNAARAWAVIALQAGKARCAASIAARVSCSSHAGTLPTCWPEAGSSTSSSRPLRATVHSPPMKACCRSRAMSSRSGISTRPQFLLMRLGHRDHAVEAKVVLRRAGGRHGRAPAFVGVAAVDPGAGQAEPVGRRVVVKQALGGVQDVLLLEAEVLLQTPQHVLEVARAGLVGADVLRGVDR